MPRLFQTILIGFAILAISSAAPIALDAANSALLPSASDAFADSVGVDTHFNYPGTPYTEKYSTIAAALIASGIRHIRDGSPGYSRPKNLTFLAEHGVRHSLSFPFDTTAAQISSTIQANAPYVDFVEPQNELDLKARTMPDWANAWRAEQQLLYSTVRSDPTNASIVVVGPAIGHYGNSAELGSMDRYEDVGSLHHYPCAFGPGDTTSNVSLAAALKFARIVHVNKPLWTTEIGYPDDLPDGRCALTDAVIAKYDTRTIADRWLAGQMRTYFYQFSDMGGRRGYDSMGLVDDGGNPKPQYTAIQSMLHFVSDPGPPFPLTPLTYELRGQADDLKQLLLEKRDRSYVLMLWLDGPSWDVRARRPLDVAPRTFTLVLARRPAEVTQFTYGADFTLQKRSLVASTSIAIPVNDSISFVVVRP